MAFNDLALARVPGEGVVEAELEVDGRRSGRFRCDAIVVSTAIGSTAYSYSAGGPVVSPALDAIVVAPAAPMSGISRPMVLSGGEPIRLTLLEGGGTPALELDGTVSGRAQPGEAIDIRLRTDAGLVVRLDNDRHQRRNLVKLSLLDLQFLPDESATSRQGRPRRRSTDRTCAGAPARRGLAAMEAAAAPRPDPARGSSRRAPSARSSRWRSGSTAASTIRRATSRSRSASATRSR